MLCSAPNDTVEHTSRVCTASWLASNCFEGVQGKAMLASSSQQKTGRVPLD